MLELSSESLPRPEDWGGGGEEANLSNLVADKLAEVSGLHCSTCDREVGSQPGSLIRTPGRVDLLHLGRNPGVGAEVEDQTVDPTFCPGDLCREVRDEQCRGHRPILKIPTPIANPSPAHSLLQGGLFPSHMAIRKPLLQATGQLFCCTEPFLRLGLGVQAQPKFPLYWP